MTDPEIQRLRKLFWQRARDVQYDTRVTGRTGVMNVSTGIVHDDPCLDAPTGMIWFRAGARNKYDPGRAQYLVWHKNKVTLLRSNAVVEVDYDRAGDLVIVDTPALESALQYGDATTAIYPSADPPPPELNTMTLPVANLEDFKPVWDSVNGGLYIYVAPGWYNGHRWLGGSIDLAAYVTATASRKAWVVGVFDADTGAITAGTSDDYYLSQNPTPTDGIGAAIATLGVTNRRNIFAVAVPNGATTSTGLSLVDIREIGGMADLAAVEAVLDDHEDRIVALETAPASAFADLTDVDMTTTPPTDGQVPVWDASVSLWKPNDMVAGGGGGGLVVTKATFASEEILYRQIAGAGGLASPATITVSEDYDEIEIIVQGKSEATAVEFDALILAFNGDTTASNYRYMYHVGGSGHVTIAADDRQIGYLGTSHLNGFSIAHTIITIPNPRSSLHKSLTADVLLRSNATTTYGYYFRMAWENTAPITSITLSTNSGLDFAAGTILLAIGKRSRDIVTNVAGSIGAMSLSDADVSTPPTAAELTTEFGTPAANEGKLHLLDDGGGDANVYLVTSNGSSWYYHQMTKAT
jgi:hypothetical protein